MLSTDTNILKHCNNSAVRHDSTENKKKKGKKKKSIRVVNSEKSSEIIQNWNKNHGVKHSSS